MAGGLAIHVFLGVEALDLARDLAIEDRRVEMRDPADARNALDHVRPDRLDVIADRCDEAHAGDGHTATVGVGCHGASIRTPGPSRIGIWWENQPLALDIMS
jgi:hypothetical protein